MGDHEITLDFYVAVFGFLMLLHARFAVSGILGLRRLRAGLAPLNHSSRPLRTAD